MVGASAFSDIFNKSGLYCVRGVDISRADKYLYYCHFVE